MCFIAFRNCKVSKISMVQIQPADPRARRKAIWMVAIATLLGFCVILAIEYFQHDLQSWLERNIDFLVQNTFVVFLAALVFISPVLAAAIYLLWLGNRTVRAQRFPPPEYAVYRDTHVLEGLRAVHRGRIIQLLSILLLCVAGAIPLIFWYIFRSLSSAT